MDFNTLIQNFSIGIISGIVSGMMSSVIWYLYTEHRNNISKIIDYGERTYEYAQEIFEEAKNIIDEARDDQKNFTKETHLYVKELLTMMRRDERRKFLVPIRRKSKESHNLQDAIADCNLHVYQLAEAARLKEYSILYRATFDLAEPLLNLANATERYKSKERSTNRRNTIFFIILTGILLIVSFVLLV